MSDRPEALSAYLAEVRLRFGQNCKAARFSAGLRQHEVAARTSIPQSTMSKIEKGRRNLTLNTMADLAEALGQDLANLFERGWSPAQLRPHTEEKTDLAGV